MHIRTLTNPTTGTFAPFDRNYFCSTAVDGTPFLSCHTLVEGDLWIGRVFRDFPDEDWQISLRGTDEIRGAWASFDQAQQHLLKWHREQQEADRELRRSWGLSVDLAKDEYRQIDLLAG